MSTNYTFTSESVTEGHPDKMADQVSDSVLDAILAEDPCGRVACETLLTTGLVVVAGEITTSAYVDIPKIVRQTICDIGYDRESYGFDGNTCGVIVSIDEQSPDIAQGVDTAFEVRSGKSGEDIINCQGAGDQGMMFGYACDETPDLMPHADLVRAPPRRAARPSAQGGRAALPAARRQDPGQRPLRGRAPRRARDRAHLHPAQAGLDIETLLKPDLSEHVIQPLLPAEFAGDKFEILANPTGNVRASAVPPATPASPVARSSWTPTAAPPATAAVPSPGRTRARSTVPPPTRPAGSPSTSSPSGAARRCEIQVAYAIGVARPMSVHGRDVRHRARSTRCRSNAPSRRSSTCARPPSSATSTCAGPSTARPLPTGTSVARTKDFTWEDTSRLDDLKRALGEHSPASGVRSGSCPDVPAHRQASSTTASRRRWTADVRVGTMVRIDAPRPAGRRLGGGGRRRAAGRASPCVPWPRSPAGVRRSSSSTSSQWAAPGGGPDAARTC